MEKKTLFIGTTKPGSYDRSSYPVTLEIELEEKEGIEHFQTTSLTPITPPALCLSIQGNIGNQSGGQIHETLKELTLNFSIDYRPGWNADRLTPLLEVWERWHLNDMKAGCIHQSKAEARKELTIIKVDVHPYKIKDEETRQRVQRMALYQENRSPKSILVISNLYPDEFLVADIFKAARNGEVYKPKTPGEQSYFDCGIIEIRQEKKPACQVYPKEHPQGILNKACPECGYKYGSQWLFEPLPQEVIDFIEAIDQSTAADLEDADAGNVKGFVKRHKIAISLVKVEENNNAPDWKDANHFFIRLWYQGRSLRTYFSQGKGIEHNPTAADVLDCLAMDARTLQDYPDPLEWAGSLGLETGTKTAKIFKATTKNTEKLNRLLGSELMRELLEETETL